jgi:hypothetical protein
LLNLDQNWDGVLDYEEFAFFCEENLLREYREDPETLKHMIKGFLQLMDKKVQSRKLMWKLRASLCDQFCRWAIPPGFFFFLAECVLLQESDYKKLATNKFLQAVVILSGLFPIMLIFIVKGLVLLVSSYRNGTLFSQKKDSDMELFQIKNDAVMGFQAREEPVEDQNYQDDGFPSSPSARNDGLPALRVPARNPSFSATQPGDPSPRPNASPRAGDYEGGDASDPQAPARRPPMRNPKAKPKVRMKRKSSEDRATARQNSAKAGARPPPRGPLQSSRSESPAIRPPTPNAPGTRQYAAF